MSARSGNAPGATSLPARMVAIIPPSEPTFLMRNSIATPLFWANDALCSFNNWKPPFDSSAMSVAGTHTRKGGIIFAAFASPSPWPKATRANAENTRRIATVARRKSLAPRHSIKMLLAYCTPFAGSSLHARPATEPKSSVRLVTIPRASRVYRAFANASKTWSGVSASVIIPW